MSGTREIVFELRKRSHIDGPYTTYRDNIVRVTRDCCIVRKMMYDCTVEERIREIERGARYAFILRSRESYRDGCIHMWIGLPRHSEYPVTGSCPFKYFIFNNILQCSLHSMTYLFEHISFKYKQLKRK